MKLIPTHFVVELQMDKEEWQKIGSEAVLLERLERHYYKLQKLWADFDDGRVVISIRIPFATLLDSIEKVLLEAANE